MKKKLLILVSALLCVSMLGSAIIAGLPAMTTNGIQTPIANGEGLPTTDLATPTFNTSIPASVLNLGASDAENYIKSKMQATTTFNDGYTSVAISGSLSSLTMDSSYTTTAGAYIVIGYRATQLTGGKLDVAVSSTGTAVGSATTYSPALTVNGAWNEAVIDTTGDTKFDGTKATYLRLKFTGSKSGDSIDLRYVAFFSSKADADKFDYAEYTKYLAYQDYLNTREPWPEPTYSEMTTTANDYNTSSVTYVPSADGSQMTISYKLNGATISNTVPNNKNYLFGGFGGTDDLGRELYDSEDVGVYGSKGERYVGLFYFLWHGSSESGTGVIDKVYNLQEIIDNPEKDHTDRNSYGPAGVLQWFAEPLYGYYVAGDSWVMRKHAELLCNANIDFLYFDATNGYAYVNNALAMMRILHDLNEQGYDAPQVVFYTNTNSASTVSTIYNNVYNAHPELSDTWFRLDGKPVIVAKGVTNTTHTNFFNIKTSQWPNESNKNNGWPWMDFSANGVAQTVFSATDGREAINVSIAQHQSSVCFSTAAMYDKAGDRGRSYSPTLYTSITNYFATWKANQDLTKNGANFQWQWDNAHKTDAEFVLVTGWNEWVAQLQPAAYGYNVRFVDCASMEFSRDAEMMAFYDGDGDGVDDGYFDNYYMQLVQNVEKRLGDAPVIVQDGRKPINVTGEFSQWDDIKVTYYDMEGDTTDRDYAGYGTNPDGTAKRYTDTSGRNDIVAAKVTSDTKNLYFYVETADQITYHDRSGSWMQLFIDIDNNANTGWYGYDYIANYETSGDFVTSLYKFNGTDRTTYSFTKVGNISYRVWDNMMMLEIPQSMVGINGNYLEIDLQFKWADSKTEITTMQQFYTEGDAAPLGRLNFIYQNYIPSKSNISYPDDSEYTYPTDNSQSNTATGSSYRTSPDAIFIDGVMQNNQAAGEAAHTWLTAQGNKIEDKDASMSAIGFYGWTQTGAANIAAFGYEINGQKVWNATKAYTYTVAEGTVSTSNSANNITPDFNLSSALGDSNAKRAFVEIYVGDLAAGVYNINILIKLTTGEIYSLNTWPSIQYVKYQKIGETPAETTEEETTVTEPEATESEPETSTPEPGVNDSLTNPTVAISGSPATNYRYAGQLLTINGMPAGAAVGYRDASTKTIHPAIINGSTLSNTTFTFSGWALANAGQAKIVWSLDGTTWYECPAITYTSATSAQQTTATSYGTLTNVDLANGAFSGLTLDLSSLKGQTVDLRLAVLPSGNYICHFATIENLTIGDPTTDIQPSINAAAVSVGKDLSINFYASLPTTAPAQGVWAIRVTMNGTVTYIPVSSAALSNAATNEYAFLFEGITPQCMGDAMKVELVIYDAASHTIIGTAYDTLDTYSVKQNLLNLQTTYASDAKLMTLIADLLNYGAAAQNYVSYKTDDLITSGADTSSASGATPGTVDNIFSMTAATTGTYFTGASVYYDQGINRLVFSYFSSAANTTVRINGTVYTATANGVNNYLVMTNGLSALDFDKTYTVELLVNGTVVQTLTYSVNSYAYRVCASATADDANATLALALYRYGKSAESYKTV